MAKKQAADSDVGLEKGQEAWLNVATKQIVVVDPKANPVTKQQIVQANKRFAKSDQRWRQMDADAVAELMENGGEEVDGQGKRTRYTFAYPVDWTPSTTAAEAAQLEAD